MGTMWPWGGAYFERLFRSPNQNRKFRVRKFPTFCAVQSPLQSTQDGRVTRGRQRYLLLSVRPRAGKIAACDVAGAKILLNAALRAAAGALRTSLHVRARPTVASANVMVVPRWW